MKNNSKKTGKNVKGAIEKPAAKNPNEKLLAQVPEAFVFWCHDGQVFRDIDDLVNGFDMMSDETYYYHANDQKNDFSCWIIDIIRDEKLGQDLKKAKTRHNAKNITKQRYYDLTRLEG